MNLLLINYEYPPLGGGAANATCFMGREIAREGHGVTVLTSAFRDLPSDSEQDGVRVRRVSALRRAEDRSNTLEMASFGLSAAMAAGRVAREESAQACVAFFTIPSGPAALLLRKRLGLPYVVSLRGGDVPGLVPEIGGAHRLLTPLRRAILRNAVAVVANAPALAELSMKADPVPVQVIPNGVDTGYFAPDGAPPDGVFRILFVGRLREQKNLGFTLQALRDLGDALDQPCELHVVGDGPLRAEMEQFAAASGVAARVRWHGWADKERLRALYRSAHCFVNPSLYEGMPNTVLEAMACALPVVASDIGGNRDLVVNDETGFLFTLPDRAGFVRGLRALAENPALGRRLGQNGRERVARHFSWRQVARRYVELIQAD